MKQAIIDYKKCRTCGCCIKACKLKRLRYSEKKVKVIDGCKGCGECINICPFDAITLEGL